MRSSGMRREMHRPQTDSPLSSLGTTRQVGCKGLDSGCLAAPLTGVNGQRAQTRRGYKSPLTDAAAFPGTAALWFRLPAGGHRAVAGAAKGSGEQGAVREVEEMVEMRGLEPLTPAMRTRCSPS